MPGLSDAAKLSRASPFCGAGDVAFDALHRLGASDYKFSALNNPARMRRYRRFVNGLTTGNARLAVETRSATPSFRRTFTRYPHTS